MVGSLHRAYKLGGAACTCDQGPRGNEWYPGRGESPEAIADRRWNTEDHVFEGGGTATSCCLENFDQQDFCKQCGDPLESHLHTDSEFYKKYFAYRAVEDEALFLARDAATELLPADEDYMNDDFVDPSGST
jgi:hypothetical protein